MNEPVVKLSLSPSNQVHAEMTVPSQIHAHGAPPVTDYANLWGFKDYGMVHLLTRDQVKALTDQPLTAMEEGVLYLEIRHHPTLSNVRLIRDEFGRLRPSIGVSSSVIRYRKISCAPSSKTCTPPASRSKTESLPVWDGLQSCSFQHLPGPASRRPRRLLRILRGKSLRDQVTGIRLPPLRLPSPLPVQSRLGAAPV